MGTGRGHRGERGTGRLATHHREAGERRAFSTTVGPPLRPPGSPAPSSPPPLPPVTSSRCSRSSSRQGKLCMADKEGDEGGGGVGPADGAAAPPDAVGVLCVVRRPCLRVMVPKGVWTVWITSVTCVTAA